MVGTIRRPNLLDTLYLSQHARNEDKEESFLLSGKDMMQVFNEAERLYLNSWVWEVDGKLVCMYGVTPYGDGEGVIWFIATDEFDKHKNVFGRGCKEVYNKMIEGYDYLFNYVQESHKKAIRWLEWLGAEILKPEPIGINGEMFCKFEVRNV